MDNIKNYIKKFRQINSFRVLLKNTSILISVALLVFIISIIIEEIFYLSIYNRRNYIITFLSIFVFSVIYILTTWARNYFGLNKDDEQVAIQIGHKIPKIKDRLLNAIQLNKINPNLDLIKLTIQNISSQLKDFKINKIISLTSKKELNTLIIILTLFIIILLIPKTNQSANRLMNYKTNFIPPTPFKIIDFNQFNSALSGDTLNMSFGIRGEVYPDSITLYLKNENIIEIKKINNVNNKFSYNLNNLKTDITYWVKYDSYSFFSQWDSIGTKPQKIIVKKRPKTIKTNFTITPPKYTQQKIKSYTNESTTQYEVLNGSNIKFDFEFSKEISNSWMLLNDERFNLNILDRNISGNFLLNENKALTVYCLDNNSIPNLNPTQFTFLNINDSAPSIIINSPNKQFEIDESYKIYTNLNINDNFGITDIWIEYKIITPGFTDENQISQISLNDKFVKNTKEINIIYNWDIDDLGLLMGDEIHFWYLAKDNNPNTNITTKTDLFIGKFPSLEDLFTDIKNYESESESWLEDIKESIEDISDITEEVELELLKQDDIGFENEKKLEESFKKVEDITEEIKKIQDNLDKIIEQAEKNNLFDENLMEKFNDFQEMLQNIMTPEIMEAMTQLQEALKNMDSESISKALENFEFNLEEFENQLDRYIDMFQMAQAEQSLNELSKLAEDLINKQTDLINELNTNPTKQNLLNSKSTKQEQRFNNLKKNIDETMNQIQKISENSKEKLDNLKNSSSIDETSQLMQNTTQNINNKNSQAAITKSEFAKENLENISTEIENIKESFLDENINKLNNEFLMIINNIITISNQQENLILESSGIRSNSPKIRAINKDQNNINIEINQLMEDLIELSNKTFFIDTAINRAFGKINLAITNSINNFEQKKISTALKEQKEALKNINLATLLLIEAVKNMNQENSPSGFEQFMEEMKNMSQKQQGVNQSTMQLSQLSMMQQQGLMGELLSQQQQLKEQLDELLDEFPGQNNGTMEKIGEDMDDIIQDFKNKKINRETIERQEQILSRMLDSQKSLTQKDYSNKRQSKTGSQLIYDGSMNLDSELGDKNYLIINAMESAMDEGHSNEYNKIIRNYFLKLQNEK